MQKPFDLKLCPFCGKLPQSGPHRLNPAVTMVWCAYPCIAADLCVSAEEWNTRAIDSKSSVTEQPDELPFDAKTMERRIGEIIYCINTEGKTSIERARAILDLLRPYLQRPDREPQPPVELSPTAKEMTLAALKIAEEYITDYICCYPEDEPHDRALPPIRLAITELEKKPEQKAQEPIELGEHAEFATEVWKTFAGHMFGQEAEMKNGIMAMEYALKVHGLLEREAVTQDELKAFVEQAGITVGHSGEDAAYALLERFDLRRKS